MEYQDLSIEGRELALYMENEESIYRHCQDIEANLAKFVAKGTYMLEGGIKAYRYAVDAAAKRYNLEHGSMGSKWSDVFSRSDRDKVAELFALNFIGIARRPELWGDLGDKARRVLERAL